MSASKWMSSLRNSFLFRLGVFFLGLSLGSAALPSTSAVRKWTFPEGKEVQASLVSGDQASAVFRLANGQQVTVAVADLSSEDQGFVREWIDSQPIVMPAAVGVDGNKVAVEIVQEDDAKGQYVYRTEHFEFTSEGKLTQNLLRDIARNFEATYELVKALPWGINPKPESGDRFRALLVRSRARYEEEGGPKGSGGVYFGSRNLFVIPFDSLGIREMGKSFTKNSDYNSDTLVHELTHQMMHAWLEILPQWVVEGTAEYTNVLPLRLGVFRLASAKSGLRDYMDSLKRRGGVPEPYPLEDLFWMTNEKWNGILGTDPKEAHRLYLTSYLLVYFFMHLDPPGDGSPFVRYLRAVAKQKEEVDAYFAEVEAFKRLPGVELLPDGRYRWPSGLKHPEEPEILASKAKRDQFEKETLGILLNGRSGEQLIDDIRSAYRKLGIRL